MSDEETYEDVFVYAVELRPLDVSPSRPRWVGGVATLRALTSDGEDVSWESSAGYPAPGCYKRVKLRRTTTPAKVEPTTTIEVLGSF